MINNIIIFLILFLIFYLVNKIIIVENFYPITTWTPYIIDKEYQPGYSNYFYKNGYMYPVY